MIYSGNLRHRVRIEGPVYTQDSQTGDVTPAWQLVAAVWAQIAPISVRDFISADSEQSKIIARITIRYRDDLTRDMRCVHNGKVYMIEGILQDKESGLEYITLPCSAGVVA